jgi:geranylgeranyl diphosphate synthase type II
MRYCVLSGGKRFRPLLCLGACESVGTPSRYALSIACSLELLHTYSLVHDDLPAMDNADWRRGQPSCHRKFGEGNAILIGDALLTLAFEWLSQPRLSRNGTARCLDIIKTVSQACGTIGLIGGQVLDLQAISQSQTATERTLRDVAQRKTGALITASVIAGALAGGSSASALKHLGQYGERIGLAFQLIDDVHDREGLAQVLGADRARAEAAGLIDRAIAALEPFGTHAIILRQLAEWLAPT